MCLVVYGHVVFDQSPNIDLVLEKLIISFHMFLFFALSGFTFSYEKSSVAYIRKRAKSLMIPYFVWGIVIGWSIANLRLIVKGAEISWDGFLYQIFTFQQSYLACWFLQVLFCVFVIEVLLGILLRRFKCSKSNYDLKIRVTDPPLVFAHVIFLIIGCIVSDSIENLFRFRQVFVASFFFWFGMLLRDLVDSKSLLMSKSKWGWIAVLIATFGAMLNNKVTFSTASFDNWVITTVVAALFCFGFVGLFSNMFKSDSKGRLASKVEKLFQTLGQHTLEIMTTHGILNYAFRMFEKVIGIEAHAFMPILALTIIMVVEYILIRCVFEHKYMKWTFGKITL